MRTIKRQLLTNRIQYDSDKKEKHQSSCFRGYRGMAFFPEVQTGSCVKPKKETNYLRMTTSGRLHQCPMQRKYV